MIEKIHSELLLIIFIYLMCMLSIDWYFAYEQNKREHENKKYWDMMDYRHDFKMGFYFNDDFIYRDDISMPYRQYIKINIDN